MKQGLIQFPKKNIISEAFEGIEKRQFKNCHNYNINSLSMSPDGENFLSSDDLRVNLWSLENSLLAYNIGKKNAIFVTHYFFFKCFRIL